MRNYLLIEEYGNISLSSIVNKFIKKDNHDK